MINKNSLKGVWINVITPMNEFGELIERTILTLYDNAYSAEITGIIPLSPVGESPSLDFEEKVRLLRVLGEKGEPMKIFPAICENSAKTAIKLIWTAESAGADGLVLYPPSFYHSLRTESLVKYFLYILEDTSLPVFLVHDDHFIGIPLSSRLIRKIQEKYSNLVGIIYCGDDLESLKKKQEEFPDLLFFSGNDHSHLSLINNNIDGMVSDIANVSPQLFTLLWDAAKKDPTLATEVQKQISSLASLIKKYPYHHALKYSLYQCGFPNMGVRLPLESLTEDQKTQFKTDLKKLVSLRISDLIKKKCKL